MTTLAQYTLDDLEALEAARPELGKVEVLGGVLYASGEEVTGYRHQTIVQRLFLQLVAICPSGFVVQLDTYWFSTEGRLRPDVAIWRETDRPTDGGAFRVAPVAVFEVLSADADHDLTDKARIYDAFGVVQSAVDPRERHGWWARTPAGDHPGAQAPFEVPGWPTLTLDRDQLLAT